jgi:predicted AAA+ superfamily ATPase
MQYFLTTTKIYYYIDDDYEVGLILEQSNTNIIDIEIKTSTKIQSKNLRELVCLAQNSKKLFKSSFIFYIGEHILPMQKDEYKFTALPVSILLN